MTQQITITNGIHLNVPVAGVFDLVNDFVAWGGAQETRRNGKGGAGYVKVYGADPRGKVRKFKVTVPGANTGYEITGEADVDTSQEEAVSVLAEVVAEVVAERNAKQEVQAEITELDALIAQAQTAQERSKFRKRLTRRKAKLAELA